MPNWPVLSRPQSARQGAIVNSTIAALGDKDAVRAFLNTTHAKLGGRPLDLAIASDAGLSAVEAVLRPADFAAVGVGK